MKSKMKRKGNIEERERERERERVNRLGKGRKNIEEGEER